MDENAVLKMLEMLQKVGRLKLTPIKNCENKFTVEFIDKKLLPPKPKKEKNRNVNFALASHFKLSRYKLILELRGIDYPIEMKFKRGKGGGYSKIACDIFRARGYRKGKDDNAIDEQINKKSNLSKETMSKNIGDSLGKFLESVGGNDLRDLLFDYSGKKLKYKRFVHIKDLKAKNVDTLVMRKKTFTFNFENKIWVEHPIKQPAKSV